MLKTILICAFLFPFEMSAYGSSSNGKEISSSDDPLLVKAIKLEGEGRLKEAADFYAALVKKYPNDPRAVNCLAGIKGMLGDFASEVILAKRALAIDSTFYQAEINLGNALGHQGKLREAESAFLRAQKLAPESPLPIYSLGVLREQEGRVADALKFYLDSVKLDPKFESGWFDLAAIYANQRKFKEAERALRRVIELNPKAEDAKQMLVRVQAEK